jgi:choline dehydrogenase-like flavoprotein
MMPNSNQSFDVIIVGAGSTARTCLRSTIDRENLTVVTGATALRLDIDGHRVSGVDYLSSGAVRSGAGNRLVRRGLSDRHISCKSRVSVRLTAWRLPV